VPLKLFKMISWTFIRFCRISVMLYYLYSGFARSPLSLPLTPFFFFARPGPPFVIRDIPIQKERSGLQIADLNGRKNGVWGRDREDRANAEYNKPASLGVAMLGQVNPPPPSDAVWKQKKN